MLIRVRVAGLPDFAKGPAHWPFPTAGLAGYDPVTNLATFDVPDADTINSFPAPGHPDRPVTPLGPVLVKLPQAVMIAWHNHLDRRYKEHEGRYRPVPA